MDGLVDIYLQDFKVWSNASSKRYLKADNYAEVARESVKAMHDQVGDLCFTADGIAKSGICVRHLVMPGKEDEGKAIVEWLAKDVSKDIFVHIMEQWRPTAHVGKPSKRVPSQSNAVSPPTEAQRGEDMPKRYDEINRPVDLLEVASVRKAAEAAGLWRFVDAAEHGGYNI